MPVNMTEQEIIDFLLLVIRHSDVTPDYHIIAAQAGIPKPMNAQRRFKTILESGGRFKLAGKTIVDVAAPATPAVPVATTAAAVAVAKKGKKATLKAAAKKRKINEVEDDEAATEAEAEAEAE